MATVIVRTVRSATFRSVATHVLQDAFLNAMDAPMERPRSVRLRVLCVSSISAEDVLTGNAHLFAEIVGELHSRQFHVLMFHEAE